MQYAIEIQNPETFDQVVFYAKNRVRYFGNSYSSDCSHAYAQHHTEAHYNPDQDGVAYSTAELGNAYPILK